MPPEMSYMQVAGVSIAGLKILHHQLCVAAEACITRPTTLLPLLHTILAKTKSEITIASNQQGNLHGSVTGSMFLSMKIVYTIDSIRTVFWYRFECLTVERAATLSQALCSLLRCNVTLRFG